MLDTYSWMPKALAQKTISQMGLLPLYHRLQQRAGRLRNFHPNSRIEYAAKLASDVSARRPIEGATFVEIGSGWVPVVPLGLYLMGAARVITFDLTRHLQPQLTLDTVELLGESIEELVRRAGRERAPMVARWELLRGARSVDDLFKRAGIEYRAPADASRSGLAANSVDCLYSNLVLEHVTPAALEAIHREALRILKDDGVSWHNVDFSDHYAATNSKLSKINFLRYSGPFWDRFGQNDILYQNRWRRSAHLQLLDKVGFKVLNSIDYRSEEIEAQLKQGMRLAPDFKDLEREDCCITASRLLLGRK